MTDVQGEVRKRNDKITSRISECNIGTTPLGYTYDSYIPRSQNMRKMSVS